VLTRTEEAKRERKLNSSSRMISLKNPFRRSRMSGMLRKKLLPKKEMN
jgi:hypothetical protein